LAIAGDRSGSDLSLGGGCIFLRRGKEGDRWEGVAGDRVSSIGKNITAKRSGGR